MMSTLGCEIDSQSPIEAAFAIRPSQIGDQIVSCHEVGRLPDWIAVSDIGDPRRYGPVVAGRRLARHRSD